MPVTSASGVQSPGSGIWVQIHQQRAQRNADQAEQQARSLHLRAREAQASADRAQENARSLNVQAGQAESESNRAKQGLAAQEALGKVQTQLSGWREQIGSALAPQELAQPVAESPAPVTNALGQQTGTLVNVTA
jgi:Fe-S cluster assembly scaffold protein SufB